MVDAIRWDPWREMRQLQQEIEQIFERTLGGPWGEAPEFPPVNLIRTDEGLVLEALVPGVDPASLEITVLGDTVTLKGERKAESGVSEERALRRERPLGRFARTVQVGQPVDPARTEARYRHGILRLSLPVAPEAKPRKVPVQA